MKQEHQLSMKADKEEVIDFSQYFLIIKNRWKSIFALTSLIVLIAALVVYSMTPTYKATAVILLEVDQQKAVSIDNIYGVDTSKKEYFETQFALLRSRGIAQKVIDRFNLVEHPEFNGKAAKKGWVYEFKTYLNDIKKSELLKSFFPEKSAPSEEKQLLSLNRNVLNKFQASLRIEPIRKTQLVKIIFESSDPQLAADLANAVGEAYIDANMEAQLQVSEHATEWLTGRIVELKAKVTAAENRLSEFLASEGLIEMSGIDSLASTELTDLSRRLADARDRRVAAESIAQILKENSATGLAGLESVSAISNHPRLRDIRRTEIEAEREVSELSKRYGPKHDKMIQAQAQLKSIKYRSERLLQDLAQGIEKELKSARKQEKSLKNELRNKKSEFQTITVKRATYDALKRDIKSSRSLYDLFVTRQKETSATSSFQTANARFTDYALTPLSASKPKKKKIIALVAFLALVSSILLAFFVDSLHNVVENIKDIEDKLGLLALGTIPKVRYRGNKKGAVDSQLYFNKKFYNFAESIRSIKTSLLLNLVHSARKVICVSSSVPNEGKTTTAVNLAIAMSSMEKVIIVDADLRKPSVLKRFSNDTEEKRFGLSHHIVMGEDLDDCIHLDEQTGVSILPAGLTSPNPQDILASDKFSALLEELARRYDKVIIDTPPLLAVSDALLVGREAGAVVLVAQASSTKISQIKHGISKLVKHNIAIDGVVLNKITNKNHLPHGYYGKYVD